MASAMSAEVASNGQSLAEAHRELLTNSALQFQFAEIKPQPPPSEWQQSLAEFLRAIGPFMSYLFWAGIAIIALLIIYFIVREIVERLPGWARAKTARATPPTPAAEFRPTKARAQALLEEADRLAREGRYDEAVRVLLHRSINDIENAFPSLVAPSLTAREIGGLEPLSARGREVFALIAARWRRACSAGGRLRPANSPSAGASMPTLSSGPRRDERRPRRRAQHVLDADHRRAADRRRVFVLGVHHFIDLRAGVKRGDNGAAHALSRSAIGLAGTMQLRARSRCR